MDVVLYLRYSSSNQSEQSIEGQERVCRDFCDREGYNVVGTYIDRATSAYHNSERRTEFQRMIADSGKNLFQGIVVYKLDRFARNRYDSAIYKSKLTKDGVRLISATESISDNPEGVLLESVLEGMAEFYSRELSQKTMRGMEESARKAHSCGGTRPLGLRTGKDKTLEIDPTEAEAVRLVFQMYADGKKTKEIAALLNQKGFRTARGKEFTSSSFSNMLTNKKYIGIYTYNNIEVPDAIPPIIDRELWDRVQNRISHKKTHGGAGKATVNFMLSGRIKCSECGSSMTGEYARSSSGKRYYYYNCSNHKRSGGCTLPAVRKEDIESAVVEETLKLLDEPMQEKIAELVEKANQEYIALESAVPSLEGQLAETETSIKNLLKLVESGVQSTSLSTRLEELEEEKTRIKTRITEAQSAIIHISKDMVLVYLKRFLNGDEQDPGFHAVLVDGLVSEVRVGRETTEIDFAVAGKDVRILNGMGRHTTVIRTPRR